jgi:hypothetical protein
VLAKAVATNISENRMASQLKGILGSMLEGEAQQFRVDIRGGGGSSMGLLSIALVWIVNYRSLTRILWFIFWRPPSFLCNSYYRKEESNSTPTNIGGQNRICSP